MSNGEGQGLSVKIVAMTADSCVFAKNLVGSLALFSPKTLSN